MNIRRFPATKEPASPRPPAVGEEVKFFHDTYLEHPRTMEHMELKECHKSSTEADNSSLNPSPPPAYRWAQSLQCLLDDHQGVALFREFLKQEGHETRSLDFRFGALGLHNFQKSNDEKLRKTIHLMYERLVIRIPSISQDVKDDIKSRLSSGVGVDVNIFDEARQEVEAYMLKNTYQNFLKSDLYIQHLEPNKSRDQFGEDQLPTLHEDKELNFSHQIKKFFVRGEQRKQLQRSPFVKGRPEAQAGYLKSPSAPYHVKYAPCLPTSARGSEVASLSSDVQTDDTMSQTDSSVSEYPIFRNKLKRPQKSKYPFVMNRDNFSQNNFIPRTQQPLPSEAIDHKDPKKFAEILYKKLEKLQEDNKKEQKFQEKLNAPELNDSFKSDSAPAQKFLLYPAEEDTDQAILDNHISMVFEETPTRSPACATPPTAKLLEECSSRIASRQETVSYSRSLRLSQPSSLYGSFAGGRMRQDPDTRSNDSGALADWISEDNLPQCHRNSSDFDSASYDRRARDKLKSKKLSSLIGSSSSCFDSGVSTACESSVQPPTHQKVATWLEAKRCALEAENERQGRTSPVPSRSSSSRRACGSSRGVDMGGPWPQGLMADPSVLPPPDTASNLREAKRILEDEAARARMGKSKYASSGRSSHDAMRGKISSRACDTIEDGISHRKQSKKSSYGDGVSASSGESTIIGYSFGRDSVPYKTKISGKNITLRQFKAHLNKRGNFRYFFKRLNDDFGTKVVLDEVSDDYEILPLWEGKVFCVIEAMDEGAMMNDD